MKKRLLGRSVSRSRPSREPPRRVFFGAAPLGIAKADYAKADAELHRALDDEDQPPA